MGQYHTLLKTLKHFLVPLLLSGFSPTQLCEQQVMDPLLFQGEHFLIINVASKVKVSLIAHNDFSEKFRFIFMHFCSEV